MQDLLCEYVELQDPLLSIVIPTYNRPEMVLRAVESALAQSVRQIEVIVIDDGSKIPPTLPDHPRLKLISIPENNGGAYVRNYAAKAATGRWITFLDDDDLMLPNLAMVSLQAITGPCSLPRPVVVLTAKQTVDSKGRVLYWEAPPSLPKGTHYSLDPMPPGTSDKCKQTFVMERELFLKLGGFDATQCCRIHSELFIRLNQECSILGVPEVTYTFVRHRRARVSNDNRIRQRGFDQLISKHRHIYEAHPKQFSRFLHEHAVISMNCGQTGAGLRVYLRALRVDPKNECLRIARQWKRRVGNLIRRVLQYILRRI